MACITAIFYTTIPRQPFKHLYASNVSYRAIWFVEGKSTLQLEHHFLSTYAANKIREILLKQLWNTDLGPVSTFLSINTKNGLVYLKRKRHPWGISPYRNVPVANSLNHTNSLNHIYWHVSCLTASGYMHNGRGESSSVLKARINTTCETDSMITPVLASDNVIYLILSLPLCLPLILSTSSKLNEDDSTPSFVCWHPHPK